jgi:hypothetical protein
MLKFFVSSIALMAMLTFFGGCGSSNNSSSDNSSSTASAASTEPAIPPDSIFAKVKVGEERDQVFATIGQPNNVNSYITGKNFIPFHEFSGGDERRLAAHYKGVGVITFGNDSSYTSGYSVVDIHYDPNEPGY